MILPASFGIRGRREPVSYRSILNQATVAYRQLNRRKRTAPKFFMMQAKLNRGCFMTRYSMEECSSTKFRCCSRVSRFIKYSKYSTELISNPLLERARLFCLQKQAAYKYYDYDSPLHNTVRKLKYTKF